MSEYGKENGNGRLHGWSPDSPVDSHAVGVRVEADMPHKANGVHSPNISDADSDSEEKMAQIIGEDDDDHVAVIKRPASIVEEIDSTIAASTPQHRLEQDAVGNGELKIEENGAEKVADAPKGSHDATIEVDKSARGSVHAELFTSPYGEDVIAQDDGKTNDSVANSTAEASAPEAATSTPSAEAAAAVSQEAEPEQRLNGLVPEDNAECVDNEVSGNTAPAAAKQPVEDGSNVASVHQVATSAASLTEDANPVPEPVLAALPDAPAPVSDASAASEEPAAAVSKAPGAGLGLGLGLKLPPRALRSSAQVAQSTGEPKDTEDASNESANRTERSPAADYQEFPAAKPSSCTAATVAAIEASVDSVVGSPANMDRAVAASASETVGSVHGQAKQEGLPRPALPKPSGLGSGLPLKPKPVPKRAKAQSFSSTAKAAPPSSTIAPPEGPADESTRNEEEVRAAQAELLATTRIVERIPLKHATKTQEYLHLSHLVLQELKYLQAYHQQHTVLSTAAGVPAALIEAGKALGLGHKSGHISKFVGNSSAGVGDRVNLQELLETADSRGFKNLKRQLVTIRSETGDEEVTLGFLLHCLSKKVLGSVVGSVVDPINQKSTDRPIEEVVVELDKAVEAQALLEQQALLQHLESKDWANGFGNKIEISKNSLVVEAVKFVVGLPLLPLKAIVGLVKRSQSTTPVLLDRERLEARRFEARLRLLRAYQQAVCEHAEALMA